MRQFIVAALFCCCAAGQTIAQDASGEERGAETKPRRMESPPNAEAEGNRERLGTRLRELVANGKLTGEEARELFELAFPSRADGEIKRPAQRRERRYEVKDPAGFGELQDKSIFSGPQPGEKLPAFTVAGISGKYDGQDFDPIAAAEGKPQLLIFSDGAGVGLRGLIGLSRAIPTIKQQAEVDLTLYVIFLGDDPNALIEQTRGAKRHVDDSLVMSISKDGRDGPGTYGLNRNVGMTILLAKDGIVTHNFPFPQSMLTPDPHLLGAMAELVGADRTSFAAWLNNQAENQERMQPRGR